jgi:hypothetical protein
MPEQSLSRALVEPEHPEHALSYPVHHDVESILAFYVPRLSFPCRILPENPFLLSSSFHLLPLNPQVVGRYSDRLYVTRCKFLTNGSEF